jgi:excinuclease ABC subunit B
MQRTVDETNRRRILQQEHNRRHGITPETIRSSIKNVMGTVYDKTELAPLLKAAEDKVEFHSLKDLRKEIKKLEKQMMDKARDLAFEEAAELRDRLIILKEQELQWM